MAGKTQTLIPTCSLQLALLTLAALTLISFTLLSLRSLRPQPRESPLNPSQSLSSSSSSSSSSSIYKSPEIFHLSYNQMVRDFKVYIYPDGDPETFYQTPRKLTGKYSSEGYFFQNIRESSMRTEDPEQADLFFVPISAHKMRGKVFGFFCFWVSFFVWILNSVGISIELYVDEI